MNAILPPVELWRLIRPYRSRIVISLFLLLVNRASAVTIPLCLKYVVDDVIGAQEVSLLPTLLILILGASALQAVSMMLVTRLMTYAAQDLIMERRRNVHRHLLQLPIAFFDRSKTGDLVSRTMNDPEGFRNLVGPHFVEYVSAVFTAVFAFAVLCSLSLRLTLWASVTLLAYTVVMPRMFRIIEPVMIERARIKGAILARLTEAFAGVRTLKVFSAELAEERTFSSHLDTLLSNIHREINAKILLVGSVTFLTGLTMALILYAGTQEILAGDLTVGGLLTFAAFMYMLVAPISRLANIGSQYLEALAGLTRTNEVLAVSTERANRLRQITLGPLQGEVSLRDVSFAYDERSFALRNVSFDARPGTVTALVGRSGSGKTTLLELVAAFREPNGGRVYVDGLDLSTVTLESYRPQVAAVFQESFLFDGTIRGNVLLSRPTATAAEVLAVCQLAHVSDFAERLPDGYDSVIGERGVQLSGGEKQRLAIARALLANAPILLLDEATSNLDTESERLVQIALEKLMVGRTTFVIAHRLSTVRRADQILVLDDGQIVQRGTHDDLIGVKGPYSRLHEMGLGRGRSEVR